MGGRKGYALKCEACGHEDVATFPELSMTLKELFLKAKGKKCPKCAGRMKIDESKHIAF